MRCTADAVGVNLLKVCDQSAVFRCGEGIACTGANFGTSLGPVDEGVTSVGSCRQSDGLTVIIGTAAGDSAALSGGGSHGHIVVRKLLKDFACAGNLRAAFKGSGNFVLFSIFAVCESGVGFSRDGIKRTVRHGIHSRHRGHILCHHTNGYICCKDIVPIFSRCPFIGVAGNGDWLNHCFSLIRHQFEYTSIRKCVVQGNGKNTCRYAGVIIPAIGVNVKIEDVKAGFIINNIGHPAPIFQPTIYIKCWCIGPGTETDFRCIQRIVGVTEGAPLIRSCHVACYRSELARLGSDGDGDGLPNGINGLALRDYGVKIPTGAGVVIRAVLVATPMGEHIPISCGVFGGRSCFAAFKGQRLRIGCRTAAIRIKGNGRLALLADLAVVNVDFRVFRVFRNENTLFSVRDHTVFGCADGNRHMLLVLGRINLNGFIPLRKVKGAGNGDFSTAAQIHIAADLRRGGYL